MKRPTRTTTLTPDRLATLLAASRGQWLGIVHAPDGIAGLSLGLVEVPTSVLASASHQGEGGTGTREGRLDLQRRYTNFDNVFTPSSQLAGVAGSGFIGAIPAADQLGRDGEAALAAGRHAVEPQKNPRLTHQTEQTGSSQAVMDKGSSSYANVGEHGALVGEGAIAGIANDDIGRDFSTEGREWTASDLEILNLEELALQPFMFLPPHLGGGGGLEVLIGIAPEHTAPALSQQEYQEDNYGFDHVFSFGSPTVPPDQEVVNDSGVMSHQQSAVTSGSSILAERLVTTGSMCYTVAGIGRSPLITVGRTMARGREKDRKTRKKHQKNVKRVKALAKARRGKKGKKS